MKNHCPSLIDMITGLIATPSMSSVSPEFDCSNMHVINLLAEWLEHEGFSVEVTPLPHQPNKANLLATIGPVNAQSKGLMLSGHTDTVPYDETLWKYDPFKLIEHEQKLYGLGTSDMKAFFALAIEAVRNSDIKKLKHPVVILATADEESSMDGGKLIGETGCPYVGHAVIGEPTNLKPINAHKGMMMESIQLIGRSGHSSEPDLGINSIDAMRHVIGSLIDWRNELKTKYHNDIFSVASPTLNLGHIHGGDNPNRICGNCELHFDLRPLPGMNIEELRQLLKQRMELLFRDSPIKWQLHSLCDGTPPLHTPRDSKIATACEELTQHSCQAVSFCTEGPYLTQQGITPIILGPGDIKQAHQPDEYLALNRLQPTIDLLTKLIQRICY